MIIGFQACKDNSKKIRNSSFPIYSLVTAIGVPIIEYYNGKSKGDPKERNSLQIRE
jgi:hypothetical protein